jgi:hypothetical protein
MNIRQGQLPQDAETLSYIEIEIESPAKHYGQQASIPRKLGRDAKISVGRAASFGE